MSNIKRVTIRATVPFHFISDLTPEEAKTLFVWTTTPTIGLVMSYESAGSIRNDHGGITAMYRLEIEGEEAIPFAAIERIISLLGRVGQVTYRSVIDLEA